MSASSGWLVPTFPTHVHSFNTVSPRTCSEGRTSEYFDSVAGKHVAKRP